MCFEICCRRAAAVWEGEGEEDMVGGGGCELGWSLSRCVPQCFSEAGATRVGPQEYASGDRRVNGGGMQTGCG